MHCERRVEMKRCPCCGYLTIDDLEEVITDICEVCYWQYDEVSQNNPSKSIGPNNVSLVQARENYKKIGAIEERFIEFVRKPNASEIWWISDCENLIFNWRLWRILQILDKKGNLPIEYINRDGNILILNTRSSQALTQAGIPRNLWNAIDRTGDSLFEELLDGQLSRNHLTNEGISVVRPSGGR